MDALSSVSAKDVKQAAETFVLKKSMEVASNTVLSLVGAATASAPQQTNNPPNLGNQVDVRV